MRVLPAIPLPLPASLTSLASLALVAALGATAEPPATTQYPLWDGSESIEQYAEKVNLEPTMTLNLGNGVRLEMVLIPAGKFRMGTPEPVAVDEAGFRQKIIIAVRARRLIWQSTPRPSRPGA